MIGFASAGQSPESYTPICLAFTGVGIIIGTRLGAEIRGRSDDGE